ncbi:MAG: 4-hydroxy-tetrahydrodipicolinate synthase [Acidobacteriota bacterium]|nr:4-hydroxy-tetrahydrodipicolinate synthase [Acidobacteriota bacterium]
MTQQVSGVWTALVTPFDDSGRIDLDAFIRILHRQAEAGVHGVIPCGTTGEAPALTTDEKKQLIRTAVNELRGSETRVIAGTGSNNYDMTYELSQWASAEGVEGILVVTPYYNKPSQDGLLTHFRSIADAVECRVVPYNVPSRTGVCFSVETIVALAAHPRIVALKEATGDLGFCSNIQDHLFEAGLHLDILSGDDATFFPLVCVGASGVISVTSNLCPEAMMQLYRAVSHGSLEEARKRHWDLYPLFRDLFVECNPVPVKFAMARAGLINGKVRPPLASLTSVSAEKLERALRHCRVEGIS